ncbi:translation initiation factor eIF-2B subunit gamma [Purpureocillium lavendulum]|uniref:Mannose-1-phosphate guanyltransferase n=1 Tax=Purpureocillium lavendulum TaxID=1247861 RepID=A0AB34FL99_9HYPO|nr:translation initiation factor eIF-2B subunit gamma [Purpureocillium lavendulum]
MWLARVLRGRALHLILAMPHATSMPSTGLQAVILCGPGSSFPTFTSNPDESPKALLPVANRPMVWYPIDFCLRSGITDITLVCPPSASEALTAAMNTNPYLTGLPLPRPDILAPADLDQNTGTAQILRLPEIRELIKSDFIVLPCDLICELAGEKLLQAWMVKAATPTDLLTSSSFSSGRHPRHNGGLSVWYDTKTAVTVKGEETDFVATTPLPSSPTASPRGSIFQDLTKLVYSLPTDSLNDITEERNSLPLRHGLLRANPRAKMHTTKRDAHIYIFPRWILDFVKENDRLESIGEDVLGWWAKAQWQAGLAEKLHFDAFCSRSGNDDDNESTPESITSSKGLSPPGQPASKSQSQPQLKMNDRVQVTGKGDESLPDFEVPPVLAYIQASQGQEAVPLIRRVDTAQLLLAISLQLAKLPSIEEAGPDAASPFAHPRKVAYPEGVKSRTTITKQDSLIGENVTVEEKTSIKETVVGSGCQIQEGAKLSQCVLMDGVVVGKGCKLTKCILGKRCVIGDGSVLTDCEVQENLLVEPRTEDKDNKLMSSEGLEATEAEMEEVLQEVDEEVAAVADEAIVD